MLSEPYPEGYEKSSKGVLQSNQLVKKITLTAGLRWANVGRVGVKRGLKHKD